jgi:hypothetical protein
VRGDRQILAARRLHVIVTVLPGRCIYFPLLLPRTSPAAG